MCHLNLIIRSKNFDRSREELTKICGFLQTITSNSYESNDDGDGIYANGTILKSKNKVNVLEISSDIAKASYIITHQRWATHGKTEEYTQPFKMDNFILAHNGVLGEFSTPIEHSDTYNFFKEFIDAFNKAEGEREDKIVLAIQTVLNEVTGSFSIALFDEKTDILYYFKSSSTAIYRYGNKENLFITTSTTNDEFLYMWNKNLSKQEFKDRRIYRIEALADSISVRNVGKIKEYEYKYSRNEPAVQSHGTYDDYDTKYYNESFGRNSTSNFGNNLNAGRKTEDYEPEEDRTKDGDDIEALINSLDDGYISQRVREEQRKKSKAEDLVRIARREYLKGITPTFIVLTDWCGCSQCGTETQMWCKELNLSLCQRCKNPNTWSAQMIQDFRSGKLEVKP